MSSTNNQPNYLKFRQSTQQSNRFINDRGDFLKINSPTNYNLNGKTYHTPKDVAQAMSKLGKK